MEEEEEEEGKILRVFFSFLPDCFRFWVPESRYLIGAELMRAKVSFQLPINT